jgi:acetylornithine deacetylase/succinyl-diaminopimelate desuccinylase-like protein
LRFVPGLDPAEIEPALRQHLHLHGFDAVDARVTATMSATRLDPDSPWVGFILDSLQRSTAVPPALLPGIGGSLPNAPFAHTLGLPTLWIPHSYPGCSQHAPNEHLPTGLMRQALAVMAGVFSDLADLEKWPTTPNGAAS